MEVSAQLRGALMVLCLLMFCSAFVAMCVTSWRNHRQGQGNFHGSLLAELCWVMAPFAIVAMLVWPTVRGVWPV